MPARSGSGTIFVFSGDMKIGSTPSATSPAAQTDRCDRGGVDRHVGIAVQDAFQRLAEPGRAGTLVGDLVELAVMLQWRLALQDLAQDLDVFAGAGHRLADAHHL